MSRNTPQQLRERKRRMHARLRRRRRTAKATPVLEGGNVRYEVADRIGAIGVGGIGMIHQLARRTGLVAAIDRGVHVLKSHLPYLESDYVLNIAYNVMAGGTCLEDIKLRRRDEHYLDALGDQTIPDPTTADDATQPPCEVTAPWLQHEATTRQQKDVVHELSITHISTGKFVAQFDIHQANHAAPQDGVARWRVVGAGEVAAEAGEGHEVVADGVSSAHGRLGIDPRQDAKFVFSIRSRLF